MWWMPLAEVRDPDRVGGHVVHDQLVETYNLQTTTAVCFEYYPLNCGCYDVICASAPCFFSRRSLRDRMTEATKRMDGINSRGSKYDISAEAKEAEKRRRKRQRKKQREREKAAALAA